ncbi:hypothetical protein ACGF8D_26145 [Streptomyces massasporeus]
MGTSRQAGAPEGEEQAQVGGDGNEGGRVEGEGRDVRVPPAQFLEELRHAAADARLKLRT